MSVHLYLCTPCCKRVVWSNTIYRLPFLKRHGVAPDQLDGRLAAATLAELLAAEAAAGKVADIECQRVATLLLDVAQSEPHCVWHLRPPEPGSGRAA